MSSRGLLFERISVILVAIAVVVDAGLSIYVKRSSIYLKQNSSLIFRFSEQNHPLPAPYGFSSIGVGPNLDLREWRGWAVRLASKGCNYCKEDEPTWQKMVAALEIHGYHIVTISPYSNMELGIDAQIPKNSIQESFVDLGWLKHFSLDVTPTLMIFDRTHGLIWSHQGMLDVGDPDGAIDTIEKSQRQ